MALNKRAPKSAFVKSMATLVSGSVLAQAITIVVSPITTRLFTPSELGVYTLVVSSVTMFGAVLSLRYDMAIVYEEKEGNVFPLVALSAALDIVVSLIVAIGYYCYFQFFSSSGYPPLLAAAFTFVQCALFGLVNVLNSYNNRKRQYRLMSSANAERAIVQNAGIVGSGLLGLGATGLIAAQSLGYIIGVRKQTAGLAGETDEFRRISRREVIHVARLHRKQALWSAPAAFANGFAYSVINYFIEFLYSSATVGYYSLSYRMLGLPTNIVATNISRVFAERATHDKQTIGNFRRIYRKTLIMMVGMSIPIGIILMAFAPQLFAFVFGPSWEIAGEYVRILTPMFVLRFIAGGLNSSAMIANKQQWDLVVQALLVFGVLLSFGASLALALPVEGMLKIINIVSSAVYVYYIFVFWHCAKC